MSKQSSSRGKLLVAALILAAAGVGAWFFFSGDDARQLADAARRQIEGVPAPAPGQGGENLAVQSMTPPTTETPAGADTPPASGASGMVVEPPKDFVPPEPPPVTGPQSSASSAEARLDKAMSQSSAGSLALSSEQKKGLPASGGALSDAAAPESVGRNEDSVVGMGFVRGMARWLVASYQPSAGGRGSTAASLAGANIRFGSSLEGLRHVGDDPVRGRESVLAYAYTPGMLDALYRMYADRFIIAMTQAAAEKSGDRPPLSPAQTADMFSVYAGQFRLVSASLRGAAALPDLHERILSLHKAGDGVVKANGTFADALFAFEEARDAGKKAEAEKLRLRMQDASHGTEKAIQTRARERRDLADAIKRNAGGRTLNEDALVYLAEWIDRRGDHAGSAEATVMAASVFDKLADQCEAQATLSAGATGQP